MDGLIFLVVLIIIVVIIVPIILLGAINSKLNKVQENDYLQQRLLLRLEEQLNALCRNKEVLPQQPTSTSSNMATFGPAGEGKWSPDKAATIEKETELSETPPVTESETGAAIEPLAVEEPVTTGTTSEPAPKPISAIPPEITTASPDDIPVGNTVTAEANSRMAMPAPVAAGAKRSVRKKDLEQFIGQKLVSIFGIAILVLGIFFSVKWAIDRDLISDGGKVMIGLVSGTLLIGIAHRLVRNYRAFSSILVGGGLAVFYFSIFEAYQAYHLVSQTAGFFIMVFITVIAVVLSLIYDKMELAVIAIIGGFCTPFFVSNGSGNYQILFSYLAILNIGMLALAYFKKWNLVNIICYGFTVIIFSLWAANGTYLHYGQHLGAFFFSTVFFVIFFGMNIIYNLRHKKKFAALEISLLLSNSFIYLGFGLYFLHAIRSGEYQGLFSLSLASFNFVFAWLFYKRKHIDRNLVFLLIGLVLTFLSLTAPLQLDGNYITLFWACEVAILYWLGMRTGIELVKNASILMLALCVISLLMDWDFGYLSVKSPYLTVFVNKLFLTGLVVIAVVFIKLRWLKADEQTTLAWGALKLKDYFVALRVLNLLLVYFTGFMELQYQVLRYSGSSYVANGLLWAYHYWFIAVCFFLVKRKGNILQLEVLMAIATASLAFYIIPSAVIDNWSYIAATASTPGAFLLHYLIPTGAVATLIVLVRAIGRLYSPERKLFVAVAWSLSIIAIFIFSHETVITWLYLNYPSGTDYYAMATRAGKVALPILWGTCSFLLMLAGMRRKLRLFRIISLTLFTVTILKLFVYDISNMGQGGKIAAFVILGIILLIVSFMYQKIKGLFIDESSNEDTERM